WGMSALVTYGALTALCAARFRQPPARQMGLVSARASAWLAVIFLVAATVVSSELDNVLRAVWPPPRLPPDPTGFHVNPHALVAAESLTYVGVLPLAYNLFYCGVFQPLATKDLGVIPGVIGTALLLGFGYALVPSVQESGLWLLAPALLNALILTILRQSSGSLWPVLALDALWGIVQLCAAYQVFNLVGFGDGGAHTPIRWVIGCAALTIVGLALCRSAARGPTDSSSAARG